MSFAINAAPINNESNLNLLGETIIDQKKTQYHKTQKKNVNFNSAKVNAVLENLQNMEDSDSDDNELGNFQPLSPPQSMGVENTKSKDSINPNTNNMPIPPSPPSQTENPLPNNTSQSTSISNLENVNGKTDEVDIQSLKDNFMNKNAVKEYFSNIIPNYNSKPNYNNNNIPYYNYQQNYHDNNNNTSNSMLEQNDVILKKLNYMINLLEEQQDEKTSNVTEEIILYSFLGIFMIFIVDSFARVGKYTR